MWIHLSRLSTSDLPMISAIVDDSGQESVGTSFITAPTNEETLCMSHADNCYQKLTPCSLQLLNHRLQVLLHLRQRYLLLILRLKMNHSPVRVFRLSISSLQYLCIFPVSIYIDELTVLHSSVVSVSATCDYYCPRH